MRNSSKNRPFTVRLFNTVEPVAPLYRDLIPHMITSGWRAEVMMSRSEYRAGREKVWLTEGVKIRWMPGFGLKAQKKTAKLIVMSAYIVVAAFKSLFGPAVARNIFLTQPPLFFTWGRVLKKLRKQPYYIVLMDLYPDVAVQDKLLKEGSFITKLLTRFSRAGLRRADGVIVIGRCMEQQLIEAGVAAERIRVIPNWTNPHEIVPIEREVNPFRRAQGWQDKFVVLYSGNIGVSHYFEDILNVALRQSLRPDIVFAFIGYGQRLKEIEKYKERHNLENVELLPIQEQNKLSMSLSSGDVHFVSLRAGFAGLVVPSKTYGVFAAGRPVIYQGDSHGEIARLIREEDVGCVVPLDDPGGLEEAILAYLHDPVLTRNQGRKARRLAEERFNSRIACEKYMQVLQPASGGPPFCKKVGPKTFI